jgi:hypothetical protein
MHLIAQMTEGQREDLRDLLSSWTIDELTRWVLRNTEDLPQEEQQFYKEDVEFWGSLGDKVHLTDSVVNLINDHVPLDVIEELFEAIDYTKFLPTAQSDRYIPKHKAPWSDVESPQRTPHTPYTQAPELPTMNVEDILQPNPEYKDESLYEKDWPLGPPPSVPMGMPDFSTMSDKDQAALKRSMLNAIHDVIKFAPRPYGMDMIDKYFTEYRFNPEAVRAFEVDNPDSRTRHGYNWKNLVSAWFGKFAPIEDVYVYWDSIVNRGFIPLVNPEYVEQRYGSGIGGNIDEIYTSWKEERLPEMLPDQPVLTEDYYTNKLGIAESEWTEYTPTKEQDDIMQRYYEQEADRLEKERSDAPYVSDTFTPEEEFRYLKSSIHKLITARRVLNMHNG